MDRRRLNSQQVLRSGILDLRAPELLIPDRRDFHDIYLDDNEITLDYIKTLLEEKGGIDSSQDYGCWAIVKTDSGYMGELMQYRVRTGEFHGFSLDEAATQAMEWYEAC